MVGYVYLIRNHDAFPGWVKVGRSVRELGERQKEYGEGMPSAYADTWEVVATWTVDDPNTAEARAISQLARAFERDPRKREWFIDYGGPEAVWQITNMLGCPDEGIGTHSQEVLLARAAEASPHGGWDRPGPGSAVRALSEWEDVLGIKSASKHASENT